MFFFAFSGLYMLLLVPKAVFFHFSSCGFNVCPPASSSATTTHLGVSRAHCSGKIISPITLVRKMGTDVTPVNHWELLGRVRYWQRRTINRFRLVGFFRVLLGKIVFGCLVDQLFQPNRNEVETVGKVSYWETSPIEHDLRRSYSWVRQVINSYSFGAI